MKHSVSMNETHQATVPAWTLGWRLQRALDFEGLTATAMADELGVNRGTVSRWMHDVGKAPRDAYLRHWANRCGVPFEWLKYGEDPTNHSRRRRASDRRRGTDPGTPCHQPELVNA